MIINQENQVLFYFKAVIINKKNKFYSKWKRDIKYLKILIVQKIIIINKMI